MSRTISRCTDGVQFGFVLVLLVCLTIPAAHAKVYDGVDVGQTPDELTLSSLSGTL